MRVRQELPRGEGWAQSWRRVCGAAGDSGAIIEEQGPGTARAGAGRRGSSVRRTSASVGVRKGKHTHPPTDVPRGSQEVGAVVRLDTVAARLRSLPARSRMERADGGGVRPGPLRWRSARTPCLFQERVQVPLLLCAGHRHGGHDEGLPALGQREGHGAAPGAPAAEPQQPLLRAAQVGPLPAAGPRPLPGGLARTAS